MLPQALNECENFHIVTIRMEQTTFRIRAIHISTIVLENMKQVWFLKCCNVSKGRPYSLKNKYDRFCRCCLNILHKSYMYTVDNNRIVGWIQNGLLANRIATHSPEGQMSTCARTPHVVIRVGTFSGCKYWHINWNFWRITATFSIHGEFSIQYNANNFVT